MLAVVALTTVALSPRLARADDPEASPVEGSPGGVVMATVCGASLCIARILPEAAIVWAVGGVACLGAFLDAALTPDPPSGS
jgi:hypothetical protein